MALVSASLPIINMVVGEDDIVVIVILVVVAPQHQ